jgi:hypothetical protein
MGDGYGLSWWTVDGGGDMGNSGGSYALGGTAAQPDAGELAGGSYTLAGGFWYGVELTAAEGRNIHLPLIMSSYAPPGQGPPDLVVESIVATTGSVQVVIKNQGDGPVTDEFWVDFYVNPNPPPTGVNQVWNDGRCEQGIAWGVTAYMAPGDVINLTIGDDYYWPSLSNFSGLAPGTPVYAQVDSANTLTTYGAVLENHEITGGYYNNVTAATSIVGQELVVEPSVTGRNPPPSSGHLPSRP